MARQAAPDTRERILDAAERLFYEHGLNASGLQQVIDECGCGKNLLYREFPSKDDLIVAYLERRRQEWAATMARAIEPFDGKPVSQLVAVIRVLADGATEPGFRGCPFLKASAEFPDPDHPAHRFAVQHFDVLRSQLRDLAQQAGAGDPDALADRLMLIINGLGADGITLGSSTNAAVALAEDVIAMAARRPGSRQRKRPVRA